MLAWSFGEIYYTAVLWDEARPPIPSPADTGYLLFPPLVLAGMLALLRSAPARVPPALLVDGLAAALARRRAQRRDRLPDRARARVAATPLAVATSLAYPVTDLVLLGVAVGALAGTGWRLDRTWVLLAPASCTFWLADSLYLVRTAAGHLRGRRLVRRRLVGRPAADRRSPPGSRSAAPRRRRCRRARCA